MAIPKENRQQMINMMYLVLTAMLALNVSAEIINAFKTFNLSMENSKKSAEDNLSSTLNAFRLKQLKEPKNDSITKYLNYANETNQTFDSLLRFIADLKTQVVARAGGKDKEDPNGILTHKDDMEVASGFLVEGSSGNNGKAYELKMRMDKAVSESLLLIDPDQRADVKSKVGLITQSKNPKSDWVREQFYQMPAVAAFAMLTKIENDVKNAQGVFTQHFFNKIGSAVDLQSGEKIFNKFSASYSAPASYVLQGEPYMANIALAATSSKFANTANVSVNGQHIPVDPQTGIAQFKTSSVVGEHTVKGNISLTDEKTGQLIGTYPFESKYTVAAPFATVSPTKMNVLYIGVENPVQISAAGVSAKDLNITMSNGNISGGGGNYMIRVNTPGKINVNVAAKGRNYGAFEFRVKYLPDPVAKLSNRKSGPFPVAEFKVQKGPYAELENAEFNAPFTITGFTLYYKPKSGEPAQIATSGTVFNEQMLKLIKSAKQGDFFYIEEIKAMGLDKRTRTLPALAFKIV